MPKKTALAYLDESGDLGWKLHLPFQAGGSSRHFIVAIAIGFDHAYTRFGKVVESLHKAQGWTSKHEKKWATMSRGAKLSFCQLAAKELATNKNIQVIAATYQKETAPKFLRGVDVASLHPKADHKELAILEAKYKGRSHLVYAMLVAETLAEMLPNIDSFAYCPDDLNEGQRTLEHIITYKLLIQDKRSTELNRVEKKKAMQGGLDFSDMIAGVIFEKYEHNDNTYLDILKQFITIKEFVN